MKKKLIKKEKLRLPFSELQNELCILTSDEILNILGGTYYGGPMSDWNDNNGFISNIGGFFGAGLLTTATGSFETEYNLGSFQPGFNFGGFAGGSQYPGSLYHLNFGSNVWVGLGSYNFNTNQGGGLVGSIGSDSFNFYLKDNNFDKPTIKLKSFDNQYIEFSLDRSKGTMSIGFGLNIPYWH